MVIVTRTNHVASVTSFTPVSELFLVKRIHVLVQSTLGDVRAVALHTCKLFAIMLFLVKRIHVLVQSTLGDVRAVALHTCKLFAIMFHLNVTPQVPSMLELRSTSFTDVSRTFTCQLISIGARIGNTRRNISRGKCDVCT